ncbi:MAG: hypothetical protein U0556_18980 [Dehalococcoidia bacterium]
MEPTWDIESEATLTAFDREEPTARIHVQIWIIAPHDDLPGKWGGRLDVVEDLGLRAADFMFRLCLTDLREADCFVDLDLGAGTGLIDGNGPPPTVSESTARESETHGP